MPDDADTVGRRDVLIACEECGVELRRLARPAAQADPHDLLLAYCLGCWLAEFRGG